LKTLGKEVYTKLTIEVHMIIIFPRIYHFISKYIGTDQNYLVTMYTYVHVWYNSYVPSIDLNI